MPARMTETARKQAWNNGLVYVGAFLLAVFAFTAFLSWISGQDRQDIEPYVLAVCWGLLLAVFAGNWIYGRSTSGRLLLDCGPCPGKTVLLSVVVLFLIVFGCTRHSMARLFIWQTLFPLSMAALFSAQAFSRLQVREHGIWSYWELIRWGRIASYCWGEDCTLLVSRRGRYSLRVAIPFPPEQRQAVDDLLNRFCAVRDGSECRMEPTHAQRRTDTPTEDSSNS